LERDGSEIVIGYGGNDGDCGTYWGWLVAAPESGAGPLHSYQVDSHPGNREGAIWGAGNGPSEDSSGDIYAATGNGSSGSEYDFGDSVLKLDSNLELLESWAPSNWQELDEKDRDLGSSDPVLLPDNLLFEIGKQGLGVLLHTDALGGVGGAPAAELGICGGSWGGGIYVPASATTGTLYVTCDDGLHAVSVSAVGSTEPKLSTAPSWVLNGNAVGPPIFAGGLVWVASWKTAAGHLYGLDPTTGAVKFESNLGSFMHFSTPSAAGGRLFAANNTKVTAFTIATTPTPSPTSTVLTSSANPSTVGQSVNFTATVSPMPDSGTVSFTEGGVSIAGCGAVQVNEPSGQASCQTTFGQASVVPIVATYSGDPYYAGSPSSPLDQAVLNGPSAEPPLVLIRVAVTHLHQSHGVWREGHRIAFISATGHDTKKKRPPVGTTFTFSLNQQARVKFRFTRRLTGRKVGRRCLATTTRNRGHRHCTRTVTVATLSFGGHGGINTISFQGHVSRSNKLEPGRYTLIITASNATGVSVPTSLVFTIVR